MPKFMSVGLLFMGGACYGYDDFLVWGLCAFELFAET